MKRIYLLILSFMLFASSFAQITGNEISMVSYEQSWLDSRGTLALKNNTGEDIHNVTFRITYLDMSGNPLDYEEFVKEVDIAPGMTRKLDIPSYEHSRNYHYYKTKDEFGHPAFKINFELKDYNTIFQEIDDNDYALLGSYPSNQSSKENDGKTAIVGFVFFGAWVGFYILVAEMARNRNRSVMAWVIVSIFFTPLLAMLFLLILSDKNKEESGNKELLYTGYDKG